MMIPQVKTLIILRVIRLTIKKNNTDKLMKFYFLIVYCIVLLFPKIASSQYEFSGYVDKKNWTGDVYLSLIEDYRQLSGVYPEQIIAKTTSDTTGYFSFTGDNLPVQNHMYRIHIEGCSEKDKKPIHFNGICPDSKEVLFIANNTDTLTLPFSFDDEMFCRIVSDNEKSNAFIKVDSIIDEMHFAFASYRSNTNRKINTKKWFTRLHKYVKNQNEPLTELYVHAFLSDKANKLYAYYLKDLKNNVYYDHLAERLEQKYPNSTYTEQYRAELASDKFLVNSKEGTSNISWLWLILLLLLLSVLMNIFQFLKYRKNKNSESVIDMNLTQQEQKVLNLILADKTNKEIASTMFVSISTIKTHINNLYKKLGVRTRNEVKSMYINKQ
ncbi:response regulator transcription factor [Aquimarina sp. I32.4]|uniref:response regulator transcription factor n=1 Tax=Aquimarina sp. I32.4 TaxID=2053903 RepID=UPI001E5B7E1F|nr:helix-turn-helix transcriptional regulator [Aquimarina sp. I32.4]